MITGYLVLAMWVAGLFGGLAHKVATDAKQPEGQITKIGIDLHGEVVSECVEKNERR